MMQEMFPNLCDYNDAYILVRGNIVMAGNVAAWAAFKNYAPFTKRIAKIDGATKDDAEDLPIDNLLEKTVKIILTQHVVVGFIIRWSN